MSELDTYLENLSAEFEQISIEEYNKKTPAQKLMYLYVYYHCRRKFKFVSQLNTPAY